LQVSGGRRVSANVGDDFELPFRCECGDVGCEKCVPMTASEYEALPANEPGLALALGHGLAGWEGDGRRGGHADCDLRE
jgi:hypothetical protein